LPFESRQFKRRKSFDTARDIERVECEFLTSLFQKLFAKNNTHTPARELDVCAYIVYVLREFGEKTLKVFNQNPETKSRHRTTNTSGK